MENKKKQSGKKRVIKKFSEITDEERELFDELIVPKLEFIKSLVRNYTDSAEYVDDNYNICLSEFACYIKSFDKSKMNKLNSWIHVTVKRCCFRMNVKNRTIHKNDSGVQLESYMESTTCSLRSTEKTRCKSFIDNISDELYDALMEVPLNKLSPFLLYVQGYKMEDIADIEYKLGHVTKKSVFAVKCRIFKARDMVKKKLIKDGFKRG